jgi:hypothetical protein
VSGIGASLPTPETLSDVRVITDKVDMRVVAVLMGSSSFIYSALTLSEHGHDTLMSLEVGIETGDKSVIACFHESVNA